MTVGLLLVPQVGANIDRSAMSETGRMPELPVHPVVRHGALAYAPGGAWGKASCLETKIGADRVALDQCGVSDCQVIINFKLCGAVACNGSTYQGGDGISRSAAEQDALRRLGGGQIINSACN